MNRSERPARKRPAAAPRSESRGGARSTARTAAPAGRRAGKGGAARPSGPPKEFALPETVTPALPAVTAFEELDLPAAVAKTLAAQGVTEPFPIQAATLPNSLAGRDVLGRGRTGSGKTLAFGLAMLARTAGRRAEPKAPLALVLVPTRELAQQVGDALEPYASALGLRRTTVVGGVSLTRQAGALRRGAEVLVATPGRLIDLVERGDCRLDRVEVTVLDEADQMADMGFMPQVTKLVEQTAPDGQRMLFSATLDGNIDRLVRRFLTDPVVHSVDPTAGAVTSMDHHLLHVADETDKRAVALRIAARDGRTILFVDTKRAADRFAKRLLASGVPAAALHGGRSQPQRTRTLEQFRTGTVTALVATNVAARGIHVEDLDLVVNVDPPVDHKDYLHRGGRTARAGRSGTVVTLVLPAQRRDTDRLMAETGIAPRVTRVRSSDEELARLTGAREPSGVPVTIAVPQQAPARSAAPSGASGSRRPARRGGTARSASGSTSGRTPGRQARRGSGRDSAASSGAEPRTRGGAQPADGSGGRRPRTRRAGRGQSA
ncbi:DEAD/DEAH box helicase [Streptomyces sp. C10-9-1]|uniref:DEAD/DEAH box helicase n=1 Tax=Streptomyces sp. C10-9-1 TaxID=1859285 RepID=UPI003D743628